MQKVEIAAVDGARAEAYPFGAQVTSWKPASGEERLFLSGKSSFGPHAAIRGGVPIIFPQFGGMGNLPKHGFARVLEWEKVRAGRTSAGRGEAQFRLTSNERTRLTWDHSFSASFVVSVKGMSLSLALSVLNEDSVPFQFTAALHTYLLVDDIRSSVVRGLEGATFRDAAAGGVEKRQEAAELRPNGELDRIYVGIGEPLEVRDSVRRTRVSMRGFSDVVVWNPGAERGAALPDMDPGGWLRMLCVEAAAVATPVRLAPGERWTGQQTLTAL
jgi:glucose-6-phosphate 1-epimerase